MLYIKWVFRTKPDANRLIRYLKASLVACGNEILFGIDYGLTFAVVMEFSTAKYILVLMMRWGVPAKHGDIPNAYVKADKDHHLKFCFGAFTEHEYFNGYVEQARCKQKKSVKNKYNAYRQPTSQLINL